MPVDLEKKILSGQNIVVPVYGDATNRRLTARSNKTWWRPISSC